MSASEPPSYLIIGAGIFGASTAYHLIRRHPEAQVRLIDRTPFFPCKAGASWDWNKVIRADYEDILYMRLGLEALRQWRTNPLFKPYYHETGVVWMGSNQRKESGRVVIENYKTLLPLLQQEAEDGVDCEIVDVQQLKRLYDADAGGAAGLFTHTDYSGLEKAFVNRSSGWAEASTVLTKVIQAAVAAGVVYQEAVVERLLFDDGNGPCQGVVAVDGTTWTADRVVLCTGAATARLIADSAPGRKDIQVEDRMVAAAVVTGVTKVSQELVRKYRDGPVIVHGGSPTLGMTWPLTNDGYLKFCRDVSFKNTIDHPESGQRFSSPPNQPDYDQWSVSPGMKHELDLVKKGIYGREGDDMSIETYRLCWDAVTPTQDFIITAHPRCGNLFIATAGSFHGWKFLPIIGGYVVDLLDGKLGPDLIKRWAWDRDIKEPVHEVWFPEREMRDV